MSLIPLKVTLKKWHQASLIIVISSLLTACGFHLRGEYSIPSDIQAISVTSFDKYSKITRLVQHQLRLNHIELVAPSSEVTNLHVLSESTSTRTISLYQNSRAAEQEIIYTMRYRVTLPNVASRTFTASTTRSYLNNPLTALAKSAERDLIEDEMRQVATQQMIRQMARLKSDIAAQNEALDLDRPQEQDNAIESQP